MCSVYQKIQLRVVSSLNETHFVSWVEWLEFIEFVISKTQPVPIYQTRNNAEGGSNDEWVVIIYLDAERYKAKNVVKVDGRPPSPMDDWRYGSIFARLNGRFGCVYLFSCWIHKGCKHSTWRRSTKQHICIFQSLEFEKY